MPTAKKLPSGNWRVRVFSHYDSEGKRKYKSFTATTKKQAELMAAQYVYDEKESRSDITVRAAIDRYISAKDGVLSASTVRGYRQMQKKYYTEIEHLKVSSLTTEKLQKYVSSITGTVSAKTVSNVYGLLISAVTMFRPGATFKVSLPKRVKPKKVSPSDEHVKELFNMADEELKVCIALAAFGSMRRGEVCGLKYKDVVGDTIYIHADMIEDEHNVFHYKEMPKTSESVRHIRLPEEVIALIGNGDPETFIVKRTPNAVTHAFTRLRNRLGMNMSFHDLRHYFASIAAILSVPDIYLSDFGGWRRGSSVMKEVYQNIIENEREIYENRMNSHFSEVLEMYDTMYDTESEKPRNDGAFKAADNGNRTQKVVQFRKR